VSPASGGGGTAAASKEYVPGFGGVVAERTWNSATGSLPKVTFHQRDHLGSLRLVTDATGAVVEAHDYYPFGGEMGPVGASSRRKFTGHERDEETGLDYMLARYYPASMGRFLSVDPGFDVQSENPQSWNLYGYVRNNPGNATDPDGRFDFEINKNHHKGVSADDITKAYAQQEAIRKSLTTEVKTFFKDEFNVDLNELLRPKHGGTVLLSSGDDPDLGIGTMGRTVRAGLIKINMGFSPFDVKDSKGTLFQALLLHEGAHSARYARSWWAELWGSVRVPPVVAIRRDYWKENIKDGHAYLLAFGTGHGAEGHCAEVLQFGDILTLKFGLQWN